MGHHGTSMVCVVCVVFLDLVQPLKRNVIFLISFSLDQNGGVMSVSLKIHEAWCMLIVTIPLSYLFVLVCSSFVFYCRFASLPLANDPIISTERSCCGRHCQGKPGN